MIAENLYKDLIKLITKGKVNDVFEKLKEIKSKANDETTLIVLESRWNNNEKKNLQGIINPNHYDIERNRVIQSLLSILSEMKVDAAEKVEGTLTSGVVETPMKEETKSSNLPPQAAKIFWMYDEDAGDYAKGLKVFFKNLERKNKVLIFDMHLDTLGDKEQMIQEELQKADLVVAIITPMFIVTTMEMVEEAYEKYQKPIIPVLMEQVPLEDSFLGKLVTLPRHPKYVSDWKTQSAAFLDIFKDVKKSIDAV